MQGFHSAAIGDDIDTPCRPIVWLADFYFCCVRENVKDQVLVVEDYRPLAETLEYQLQRAGYEVSVAADGQAAITQAKLVLPDAIILDVDLPILSGIEVCKQIRADATTRNALIMMLSALGEESDQVVGLAMGADDYIVKRSKVTRYCCTS